MTAELRLGAIGLGRAAGLMLPSLAAHPHVRLTAAADPQPAARARFEAEFGGHTYPDAEALCASGDVDAVYIATPHAQHAQDAIVAAAYGKHALVEKPMALTVDDCRVTNFLYRSRRPEELDSTRGGGIMYNQVPHQLEIVRTLATAPLRSVRAVSGVWDAERRTEGAMSAFLTFADGAVAQLTYSGYDHFDSDELHYWIGESGEEKAHDRHGAARRALAGIDPQRESALRTGSGFGSRGVMRADGKMHELHFGFLLASCDRADLRPAPDGVTIYTDGERTVECPRARVYPNKDAVIDELYDAAVNGVPPLHDGEWGTATMAAALALVESAATGREIVLDVAFAP